MDHFKDIMEDIGAIKISGPTHNGLRCYSMQDEDFDIKFYEEESGSFMIKLKKGKAVSNYRVDSSMLKETYVKDLIRHTINKLKNKLTDFIDQYDKSCQDK